MCNCEICGKSFERLAGHVKRAHKMNALEYYKIYILKDPNYKKLCPICGSEITMFRSNGIMNGLVDYCCSECIRKGHAQVIKKLHEDGIYKGTSFFIKYNVEHSEEHKKLISKKAKERRLDKQSLGFNSEYSDRIRNRDNILSRFDNNSDRYLYVIEFDNCIKLGSTSSLPRRKKTLNAEHNVIHTFLGTTKDIANLECELFLMYKEFTLLDETKSYYTEFLSKDCLPKLLNTINQKL